MIARNTEVFVSDIQFCDGLQLSITFTIKVYKVHKLYKL